jgi:hypothetical protein
LLLRSDEKVLEFPKVEVSPEENARRVMAEAKRLASLAPGEWRLWIDRTAERLGVPRTALEGLISAIIKDNERKAREDKFEARRREERSRRQQEREQRERKREQGGIDKKTERKRKEKEKTFERLIGLPREQHQARLAELAKRLDEDLAAVRNDFSAFVGITSEAVSTDSWSVEPWPEPVETRLLLQEIITKIRRYIVLRPEAVTATALWTMTAWAHEGATHSPILAAISVEPDSGKSTLLRVLRFLVPKPFVSVEPTGPSVYRTVDRERPTLIIDEADDLFYRKSDLRAIVNAGWSRGTRIPRLGRWYDPFCPKILGILGKTKLPRTVASRSIILRMWPKKPEEKAEDFAYADDPEFSTIRRKLARWTADNLSIIKELKPAHPPGFNNRIRPNTTSWLAGSRCDFSATHPPRSGISPASTKARSIRLFARVLLTGAAAQPKLPDVSKRCALSTRRLLAIPPPITASWRTPGVAWARSHSALCSKNRRQARRVN